MDMESRRRLEAEKETTVGSRNKPSARVSIHIDGELVDTSDAAFVKLSPKLYRDRPSLIDFSNCCMRKKNLEIFSHPGNREVVGGLESYEEDDLENDDYFHPDVNFAIRELNHLRKDVKLKLVKLTKVNIALWGETHIYMTFSAADEMSGNNIGIYQAAVLSFAQGKVLGLFRDYSNDKILAILSITGIKEDLPATQ